MAPTPNGASPRSLRALDALNFFLADVRDGVGPYLGIFLLTQRQWSSSEIGVAISAMGIAGLVAQTPAGALLDRTRAKRAWSALAAVVVALSCVLLTRVESFGAVLFLQATCGIAAALLGPAVAALTLGLVGSRKLAGRTGRNESFNHGGNVFAALMAGLLGTYVGQVWIFYLVAAMSLASIFCLKLLRPEEIDHEAARGFGGDCEAPAGCAPSGYGALLRDGRFLSFTLAMTLFHFANAAMLPLVGQMLSKTEPARAPFYMSACIVIAQAVMIPVAALAGRGADHWGRRPVLLLGLAALPLRGALYTFSADPTFLLTVQALDGIGAGVFGVLSILVVADLTRGTGRYNLALGLLTTAVGVGASLSNGVAGVLVDRFGFHVAFWFLAALAAGAWALYFVSVPETCPGLTRKQPADGLPLARA